MKPTDSEFMARRIARLSPWKRIRPPGSVFLSSDPNGAVASGSMSANAVGVCPSSFGVPEDYGSISVRLVTVVTEATTAGESARAGSPTWSWASLPNVYTSGLARDAAPPSNPRPSRAAAGAADGRRLRPEPPHRCALTAQRRTVVVTRVPRAKGHLRPSGGPPAPQGRGAGSRIGGPRVRRLLQPRPAHRVAGSALRTTLPRRAAGTTRPGRPEAPPRRAIRPRSSRHCAGRRSPRMCPPST